MSTLVSDGTALPTGLNRRVTAVAVREANTYLLSISMRQDPARERSDRGPFLCL